MDGRPAWCDGGPRGPVADLPAQPDGTAPALLHRETIRLHRRAPDRFPLRLLGDGAPGDDLAADQLDAVTHAAGPARVIAPAGSGKTRVLTARLRHLLRDRRIEPGLVTAVAYNTRAAQEMRDRLAGLPANIRTLHSLGLWICNLEQRRTLVDEREQRAILDRLVRTAKIPNQDPFQPYLDALTEVRLGLRHPDTVGVEYELDDFDDMFRRYRAELDRRDAMDFDEQIFHAIELLLTNAELRAHVQQVGTHLLVDEFQDLTPAFHLLVRLVASPSLEVFAVGDDDQVIYGYAGADPGYLIDYAAEFPGAVPHPLEVNYRCPPEVVGQVGRVLSHNRRRVDKVIRAGRTEPAPTTPGDRWKAGVAIHGVDAGAMAARTVATIEDRIAAGAHPRDIAVLARVNATLLPVQVALGEAGIPRTAPLSADVVGRTGVRTALAYLRLGLDPERLRREDLFDTLNRPSRKVKSAVSELLRGPRFSMDQLRAIEDTLSTTHADRWRGYLDDLQVLTDAITDGADTARVLWLIRNRVGLGEAMATLDSAKSRPEGSSHGDDLDALDQLAALHPDPVTFREWLVESLRLPGDDDGVVLSTVHRVKGMEWDHVVVFAANQGLMPHRLAEDEEEERRVFHVAVTRCRETVTVVSDRTSTSPFVDELRHDPPERPPRTRAPHPHRRHGPSPTPRRRRRARGGRRPGHHADGPRRGAGHDRAHRPVRHRAGAGGRGRRGVGPAGPGRPGAGRRRSRPARAAGHPGHAPTRGARRRRGGVGAAAARRRRPARRRRRRAVRGAAGVAHRAGPRAAGPALHRVQRHPPARDRPARPGHAARAVALPRRRPEQAGAVRRRTPGSDRRRVSRRGVELLEVIADA